MFLNFAVHCLIIPSHCGGDGLNQSARVPGRRSVGPDYATKSYMAGASVDHLRTSRRRTVAPAVIRGAEMRATLDHLARDAGAGLRVGS